MHYSNMILGKLICVSIQNILIVSLIDPSAEASWNAENISFFLKTISQDKSIWITIQKGENNSGELRLRRKLGMKNFSVILPKIEW